MVNKSNFSGDHSLDKAPTFVGFHLSTLCGNLQIEIDDILILLLQVRQVYNSGGVGHRSGDCHAHRGRVEAAPAQRMARELRQVSSIRLFTLQLWGLLCKKLLRSVIEEG